MKATYTIEQADNGIIARTTYHKEEEIEEEKVTVTESPREDMWLGKLLWEDIKHVMDAKRSNTIVMELKIKAGYE